MIQQKAQAHVCVMSQVPARVCILKEWRIDGRKAVFGKGKAYHGELLPC
jgi:hypothetical protein